MQNALDQQPLSDRPVLPATPQHHAQRQASASMYNHTMLAASLAAAINGDAGKQPQQQPPSRPISRSSDGTLQAFIQQLRAAGLPGAACEAYTPQPQQVIGRGKFATVYKCQHPASGSTYALKRMDLFSSVFSEASREKCLREIQLLQNLQHECIVQYVDSWIEPVKQQQQQQAGDLTTGTDDAGNQLVIVLQWARGGDLKKMIRKLRSNVDNQAAAPTPASSSTVQLYFPEQQIWRYMYEISSALTYMHQHRIIHRDIKPANIMLSDSNHILLGDFGLSRYMSEATLEAYSKVGTPLYISPEVLSGSGYSYSCDVWSLGCCIYELCTLRSPFKPNTTVTANDENEKNLNLFALFQNIKSGQYMPVQQASTQHAYSNDLYALIGAMLHLVPERRPSMEMIMRYSAGKCKDASKLKPAPSFQIQHMQLADILDHPSIDENAAPAPMQVNTLQRRSASQQPSQSLQKRVTSPSVNGLLERQQHREHRSNVQLQSTVIANVASAAVSAAAVAPASGDSQHPRPQQPLSQSKSPAAKANINAARLPVGSPGRPLQAAQPQAAVTVPAVKPTPPPSQPSAAAPAAVAPTVINPYPLILQQTTQLIHNLALLRYTSSYCLRFSLPPVTCRTFLTANSQLLYRTFTATLLWLTEQLIDEHIALSDLSHHVDQYSPLPLILQPFQAIVPFSQYAAPPASLQAMQHLQQQQATRAGPATVNAMLAILLWLSDVTVSHHGLWTQERLQPVQPPAEVEAEDTHADIEEDDMEDASADTNQLHTLQLTETDVSAITASVQRPTPVTVQQWLADWPQHMDKAQRTAPAFSSLAAPEEYHSHTQLLTKQCRLLTAVSDSSAASGGVAAVQALDGSMQRIADTQQRLSDRFANLTQHAHTMQSRLSELQTVHQAKMDQLHQMEEAASEEAEVHQRLKRSVEQERQRQADDTPLKALQATVSQLQREMRRSVDVSYGVKQVLWHQSLHALARGRSRTMTK